MATKKINTTMQVIKHMQKLLRNDAVVKMIAASDNKLNVASCKQLEEILNGLEGVNRIKGVIRIGHAWVFYNRVNDEHDFDKVAYRRDSRIEIISPQELDWEALEQQMLACLQK